MISSLYISRQFSFSDVLSGASVLAIRPLHALMAMPCLLFLTALTIMLFRPPDLDFYALDRVAFLLLAFILLLRSFLLRQPFPIVPSLTWPMLALLVLGLSSVLRQPFDPQTWSLLAAKLIVPFALFHLSMLVFTDRASLRHFEAFSLSVLAYLCFIAIAFLVNAPQLIFPRFILDESLGIHADRARGPFLQAVANGVTLNMLGLIALDALRRRRLHGLAAFGLLLSLPLAILATMTRGVWISFALSTVILLFQTRSSRLRRACLALVAAGCIGLLGASLSADMHSSLQGRTEERGPVEIRIGVYKAGWQMFLERPLLGWGVSQMPPELGKRMTDYHLHAFWVHNTYLEILVEYGLPGGLLYMWIIVGLFRVGRKCKKSCMGAADDFLDPEFRKIWPILLGAYLFNAIFVVMNYQFVNSLVFVLAGMLAAQNRVEVPAQGRS